jgi:hypothetical protein
MLPRYDHNGGGLKLWLMFQESQKTRLLTPGKRQGKKNNIYLFFERADVVGTSSAKHYYRVRSSTHPKNRLRVNNIEMYFIFSLAACESISPRTFVS